jgi:UrcA family protein
VTIIADAPQIERVGYSDLDLTTDAGVHRLQDRVRFAASKLCIESGVQSLPAKIAGKECFNAAYADGLDQITNVVEARRASRAGRGWSIRVPAK